MWDVFICHASEDKDAVARPLAEALREAGLSVWYDEFTLTLGDSLRRSIDRGLASSRYGVVILSPNFFRKRWPQHELDGLVSREIDDGEKVILPIWHGMSKEEVLEYSPTLADKFGMPTSRGLNVVVQEVLRVVRDQDFEQSEGGDVLSVDSLAAALLEFWPPEHHGNTEPYALLLSDLQKSGIDTRQQLQAFLAKWREPTLIRAAREAERLRSAADAYGVEENTIKIVKPNRHTTIHVTPAILERAKKGVFYSHAGLTFTALQFERGERSPSEPMH